MAGFLYYFPGGKSRSEVQPRLDKLSHLAGQGFSERVVEHGPAGTSGLVLSPIPLDEGRQAKCGYHPDSQTWHSAGDYWIGYETAAKPGPVDLQRFRAPVGYPVDLADGNQWVVPQIHAPHSTLPQTFRLNGNGEVYFDTVAGYEQLIRDTAERHDAIMVGGGVIQDARSAVYCVDVLNVNYRVGMVECSGDVLDLFRRDQMMMVQWCAIGGPESVAEVDAQKKTGTPPDGTSGESGG